MAPAAASCLQLQPLNNFGWSRGPAASARFNISSHGVVESASADATSSPGLVTIYPAPSLCTIRHICYHAHGVSSLAPRAFAPSRRRGRYGATSFLACRSTPSRHNSARTWRSTADYLLTKITPPWEGHNALPSPCGTGPGSNYLAFPQHSLVQPCAPYIPRPFAS